MIRTATPADAAALLAIYAPIVEATVISFEHEPPDEAEMRRRIGHTLQALPWLVSVDDDDGAVDGYAYASRHRERAAYQWAVEVSVYVHERARGRGLASRLYTALFDHLAALGYMQALAGIALPNEASVRLHESLGFEPAGVFRHIGFKHGQWRDLGWWMRPLAALPDEPRAPRAFEG